MSISLSILQQEDFDRGLARRLRSHIEAERRERRAFDEFMKGLVKQSQQVCPPKVRPAKRIEEKVKTWTNPAAIPESRYTPGAVGSVVEKLREEPPKKALPRTLREVIEIPREERKVLLAARFGCAVEDLFETILAKRKKQSICFHTVGDQEDPDALFWTLNPIKNDKGETVEWTLEGPTTKRPTGKGWVYRGEVHRSYDRIDCHHGKLPWPLIDAGFQNWKTVNLPLHSKEEEPCLWFDGQPFTNPKIVGKVINRFVKKIAGDYFRWRELELAYRKTGRLTLILIDGNEQGFEIHEPEEETPLGQRIARCLGITLLEGDKDVKRHSQFREYDAKGSIPVEDLNLILLDEINFPRSETTLFDFACCRNERAYVILQIKQILWNLGYRDEGGDNAHVLDYLHQKFKKATDGAGIISPSFRNQSVDWMGNKKNRAEYGIDPTIIRKCVKAKQMSFRAALPGSGQVKAMMQIADWLPDHFILIHSQNIKKEWRVSTEVPFRYWWDAYEGKPISRTNMQFIIAHRFLFPNESIFRWFDRMKQLKVALLEEKGFIDDKEEILSYLLNEDDSEEGIGLQQSFSTFARLAPIEIWEHGFHPLEFPVVATRAATCAISKWVNLPNAQLRIEIPGSVHYQIVSELILRLTDPDALRVEKFNGIRFHPVLKIAYQQDRRYLETIVDHGGADMDDYWDLRCVKWNEKTTAVLRLRAPTRPGEWGMDELEGPLPDAIKEIEVLDEEMKRKIKAELPRRAHLQPAIVNPTIEVQERKKRERYTWGRVLEQIDMPSLNPGMGVNMIAASWFWDPHGTPPCGMDWIVDTFTQEGLKYGADGLDQISSLIRDWFVGAFTKHLDDKKNNLWNCKFDTGFLFRKGLAGLLFQVEGLNLEERFKTIRYKFREENWYTNLLDVMAKKLSDFKTELKQWVVEKSNALEKRFLPGLTMRAGAKHKTFIDLHTFFNACYLSEMDNAPFGYLKKAVEAEGLTYSNPEIVTKETWKKRDRDICKVLDRFLREGRTSRPFPWAFDTSKLVAPKWNFKWGQEKIDDGRFTPGDYTSEAEKVKRTGGVLISRNFVTEQDFLPAAVKLCLQSYARYGTNKDRPMTGVTMEEFLLEEDNWNRFLTWVLVEFEDRPCQPSAPVEDVPPPAPSSPTPKEVPMNDDAIRGFKGEFRFLSNFEGGPIKDKDGIIWRTAEHAYQAMKYTDESTRQQIRLCPTPGQAKRMGRSPGQRPDWDRIKLSAMERIVRAKFAQNAESRAKLLATGEREIVEENTWGDRFWGVCEGTGSNHLGKILMKIRSELRQS